jgi:cellobiose epimerase
LYFTPNAMFLNLPTLKQEARREYFAILDYWQKYAIDHTEGGFWGRVNQQNQPVPNAEKSLVLNARILWTFSSAYRHFGVAAHLDLAKRAFEYIVAHFKDTTHGGVYWSVKADGSPSEQKKQMYAHAFAVYGLSEYFAASKHQLALDFAVELYQLIEKHSFDAPNGGYIEAFAPDWTATDDYILSKGDRRKSMNTHLHLLEAYTNLYRVWKDEKLHQQLLGMANVFLKHIIDPQSHRMRLFFDEKWNVKSSEISYGHDIEASWLLWETAEALHDKTLLAQIKPLSVAMAKAASDGLASDGGLNYEYTPETKHLNTQKDWWVQAEAVVGFYNAYQLSGKAHYLQKTFDAWNFTKKYIIDHQQGEWFWGVKADHTPLKNDKINAWKCPYHNSRACLEILKRIK